MLSVYPKKNQQSLFIDFSPVLSLKVIEILSSNMGTDLTMYFLFIGSELIESESLVLLHAKVRHHLHTT